MKELLSWLRAAFRGTCLAMFLVFLFCFALLGLYTAVNFALEVNAEKCAAITEHVSLCLIDAREAMKDTAIRM